MSEGPAIAETGSRRAPRWLWVVLIGSVAVNFLLIGLIAGAAIIRHRTGMQFGMAANPFGFVRSLPRERREALRQASRDQLAAVRPLWQAVRDARREADRVLAVEPFDAAAFLAANRLLLEKEGAARLAASQVLADTAARLTPDERRLMLRWRDRQRGRGRDAGPPGEGLGEGRGGPAREPPPGPAMPK